MLREIASGICAVGAVCGAGYYALCLVSIRSFLREKVGPAAIEDLPAASLLKPLKGMDAELYESFRSHCLQDYGAYEIIFGVSDLEDAAVPFVRQLQAEFPQRDITLIVCSDVAASVTNRKVGNLAEMLPHAKYNFVVVNDSDIWVPPEYLQEVIGPFSSPRVGMVTASYYGVPGKSLWSRIEAIGISTDFVAGVLAARKIEGGIRFGLGSTLAMSREALDAIGGFAPLVDYLGDDYELGARIAKTGYEVVLSRVVVRTHLPNYSWRGFWQHQLRWSRAIRDSRKKDFAGIGATFGVPWALLALIFASANIWSLALLLIVLTLRMTMAWRASQAVLHDPYSLKNIWLVPLRDCLAMAVWVTSFFGDTIAWRGERFLLKQGRLTRIQ